MRLQVIRVWWYFTKYVTMAKGMWQEWDRYVMYVLQHLQSIQDCIQRDYLSDDTLRTSAYNALVDLLHMNSLSTDELALKYYSTLADNEVWWRHTTDNDDVILVVNCCVMCHVTCAGDSRVILWSASGQGRH